MGVHRQWPELRIWIQTAIVALDSTIDDWFWSRDTITWTQQESITIRTYTTTSLMLHPINALTL